MAEVPAEAPAEGEAVAEVKIDSKLSSLRLTFPQENPLPTPCMDLTEFPPKVYPLHPQGFAIDFLFIKIGDLSQTNNVFCPD